jgi:hypothetical protein
LSFVASSFEGLLRNYFFFVPQQSLGLIKYSGVCVQPKPQPFMVRVLRFCSHGIREVKLDVVRFFADAADLSECVSLN